MPDCLDRREPKRFASVLPAHQRRRDDADARRSDTHFTAVPEGVLKYASFMHAVGTVRADVNGWQQFFLPPILDRPGS
jgi:hypothetical protein